MTLPSCIVRAQVLNNFRCHCPPAQSSGFDFERVIPGIWVVGLHSWLIHWMPMIDAQQHKGKKNTLAMDSIFLKTHTTLINGAPFPDSPGRLVNIRQNLNRGDYPWFLLRDCSHFLRPSWRLSGKKTMDSFHSNSGGLLFANLTNRRKTNPFFSSHCFINVDEFFVDRVQFYSILYYVQSSTLLLADLSGVTRVKASLRTLQFQAILSSNVPEGLQRNRNTTRETKGRAH